MDPKLLNECRRWRQTNRSLPSALKMARDNIGAGSGHTCVGYTSFLRPSDIGSPFKIGSSECRWVDGPYHNGFRRVAYADEIVNLRHTGWFMDEFGEEETARGAVFQLPARNGKPLYVPAVTTSYGDHGASMWLGGITDNKHDAARWADQLAAQYAETEREYQAASNARFKYDELGEDVARERRAALELIADIKASRPFPDRICSTLREALQGMLEAIHKARADRKELIDQFGREPGWQQ